MTTKQLLNGLVLAGLLFAQAGNAEDRPNRINAAVGGATYSGEVSGFLSADYTYKFDNRLTAAVFFEKASGDFDIEAFGITVGYMFDNGFKFSVGPGFERELKNKTLDIWHVSAGYDWQLNNFTVGPTASYDFIERNSNALYVGVAAGYSF